MIPPAKTALIAGGGGCVGAFQVGAFEVIEEYNIPIDLGIGVSAGAINLGSFFSNGFSTKHLKREWFSFRNPRDLFRYEKAYRIARSLGHIESIYQLDPILRLIGKIWAPDLIACPKEFIATATRVPHAKVEYFSNKDPEFIAEPIKLLLGIAASCAVAAVFPSVVIHYKGEYREYIDGGYDRPLPIKKAVMSGCNTIIVVRCHSNAAIRGDGKFWKLRTAMKRIPAADSMKTNRMEKEEISAMKKLDDINIFIVEPDELSETLGSFSFRRADIPKAVEIGHQTALRELAPLIDYYASQKKFPTDFINGNPA